MELPHGFRRYRFSGLGIRKVNFRGSNRCSRSAVVSRLASACVSAVLLFAIPLTVSSCGGGEAEEAPKAQKAEKKRADNYRAAAKLRKELRKLGASKLVANDWKRFERSYNAGKKANKAGDYAEAEDKFDSAISRGKKLKKSLAVVKELKEEVGEVRNAAYTAKTAADAAEAATFAKAQYDEARAILADAEKAYKKGSVEALEEAQDLFSRAENVLASAQQAAKEGKETLAEVKEAAEECADAKKKAVEAGAEEHAAADWDDAVQRESEAVEAQEKNDYQTALASYNFATQRFSAAVSTATYTKENKDRQKQIDEQASASVQPRAPAPRTQVKQWGVPVVENEAQTKLDQYATEIQATRYVQDIDPEDEAYLRANYKKLNPLLEYDPETGAAYLDLRSGAQLLRAVHGSRAVKILRSKEYLQFQDKFNAVPGDDPNSAPFSFWANSEGAFYIEVPFKYHVKVTWNMAIQTMDQSNDFKCIFMFDKDKRSYYGTKWTALGFGGGRGAFRTTKRSPNPEHHGNANLWFLKTRDIPMVVSFEMPGEEVESDDMEELTGSAKLTCIYDADDGIDEVKTEWLSDRPLKAGGWVGFTWNRVKFQVKKLQIYGILDKEKAVAQLRSAEKRKKKRR